MITREIYWLMLEQFALLTVLIPLLVELLRKKRKGQFKRPLLGLLFVIAIRLFLGTLGYFALKAPCAVLLKSIHMILSYAATLSCALVYAAYIFSILRERTEVPRAAVIITHTICLALFLVNTVLVCTGQMFLISGETGSLVYKPAAYIMLFFSAVPVLEEAALLFCYRKKISKRTFGALLCIMLLPTLSLPLALVWSDVLARLVMATTALLAYTGVHAEQNRRALQQKKILGDAQAKLVFSQMQPHFMFNVLDTIYYLCDENPVLAKQAISTFSDYLLENFGMAGGNQPVLFEKELQHTEKYLSLEKLRFEERLQIVWDISARNFRLPMLTVQPLVENAVKHGVTKRRAGGVVTIRTEELKHSYRITVADNGIGFDTAALENAPEDRIHIGIKGVRSCLAMMCKGELKIMSKPGIGTTAVILLPKNTATLVQGES